MFPHHISRFARHALGAAVAIVVTMPAPALAQNTTGAIAGLVTDGSGQPVAGAAVSIQHVESGSVSSTVTDAGGRYSARGLRVGGPYTITISKDGQTDKREDVFLALAETLSLDARLGNASVVVTGSAAAAVFNRSSMGAGTNVDSTKLAALASINRNLQDYARTDPRLSQNDKDAGAIVVAGQNNRFNSITIDGVTTNDTFGLEANNLPMLKQPVSMDAIQSVQVNVSNYDVTQKGYTGANINAVTKSGTNDWKGSLYYVFRDDGLVGKRYSRATDTYADAPKFKENLKGFTLGGPIIKDKLFLFASYEELKSSRASPDFGPVGDGRPNVAITPAAITSAAQVARDTWGFDAGSYSIPSGLELVVKDTLVKLDWTINDSHRASLRYTKTEQSEPIFPDIAANALSLSSHWYTQNKKIETAVGQWFADWTPSFSTEAKLSYRDYEAGFTNAANLPEMSLSFTGALPAGVASNTPTSRTLFMGTERSRQFNQLATKTTDAYLSGTFSTGGHELKGGLDLSSNEIFNAFVQNTRGNYTFACINSSATVSYSFGAINCATATAPQVEQAVLENFRLGRPTTFQVQVPAAGKTINDATASWTLNSSGVFLQDTWTVNRDLTLMLGARLDMQSTGDKPIYNAAAAAPMVAGVANTTTPGTGTRQTGGFGLDNSVSLDGDKLFQPRLGFNWRLPTADKRRLQLRGGLGLFEGAAPSVWLSNPYSNTGIATRVIACGSNFGNNCQSFGNFFSPDPANQPNNFSGTQPRANVDFIQPGLSQPSVWKANLALDAEIGNGMVVGAEWLHTEVKSALYYRYLNLGTATRTGSDGRPLYYNAAGYDTGCWDTRGVIVSCTTGSVASKALNNNSYANVLVATPTSLGGGDAVTLSLSQQASREFSWSMAYTRTSATEVSPLTSSVANSNWSGRAVFNPNEEVAANANALVRDRVALSANWSKAFIGRYKTSVGLFYEGRRGRPYSWTVNNDLNGDGLAGNDLMYVPSAPGAGEVLFAGGADDEARFWSVVNAYPELSAARGSVVQRNSAFAPWVNTVDVRISQELPGFTAQHKGVISLDILNVGNLLNKKWGRTDEVSFNTGNVGTVPNGGAYSRSFVSYKGIDPATGKYIYSTAATVEDLITKQNKGESQWALQVTLRYEF